MDMTISFLTGVSKHFKQSLFFKSFATCGSLKRYATYCGKTKRHFMVRVSEHMGVSARTGKKIKSTKQYVW